MKILGVDSGKFNTKAAMKHRDGSYYKKRFRTKMDITEENESPSFKSKIVEYGGQKYLIGEDAETVDFDKSKAKEIHRICTYTAVAEAVENGENVNLVIGCPIDIYHNAEERASYKKFMVGEGDIHITVNGNEKSFVINDILVCSEGSGIIYKNPVIYSKKLVGIIDIGGLNTNCSVFNKLVPIKSTSFSTNLGANIFRNELKQQLNSRFADANIQDYLIDSIIEKGFIKSHPEESADIIKEQKKKHVKAILQECRKKGWDLSNMDIICNGGGSWFFKNEILEELKDVEFSPTADFDNAIGFLELGGVKYAAK